MKREAVSYGARAKQMKAPPGPRGLEVFGFLGGGNAGRTVNFLERSARRFGPISSFRILTKRIYLVDDPDLIEEILVKRQHSFVRDTGAVLLRELIGDGLLTREEPEHRERRRILQPAFHRDQIASYADSMTREAERTASDWQPGAVIDLAAEMRRLTLAIVGECLFGADFRGSAKGIAAVIQRVGKRSQWLVPGFAFLEPLVLAYRRAFPRGPSLFFRSERAELERIVTPIIERRRQSQTRDVISLLMAQRDEAGRQLSDEDIRNEIVTFVLAGHETTATALTWTWYLLAQHPEIERKMHAEIGAIIGDRAATFDDIPRLRYTSAVFAEAMRLYPPALLFGRRPKETITLGGYTIRRGATIFLSPYITQRNERFFERPTAFEPERWEAGSPPKFAYFPFGGGAKMCIGEPFARMEGVLVLAALARHWRLALSNEKAVGVGSGMILRPDRPIMMRLELRQPASSMPQPANAGAPL
jgi:cytochrome P450